MKKKSHESFSSAFENSWKVASNNPSDIQLWAGIRILNSWVKEDTDTLSLLQLFIPPSPSNKSTWNCPPLTPLPSLHHTHTHTESSCQRRLSESSRQSLSRSPGWRQVTMVLWLLLCSAHQGMEISVHMFLKALWERSVGAAWGHNGRLCCRERIWSSRPQAVLMDTVYLQGQYWKACAGFTEHHH